MASSTVKNIVWEEKIMKMNETVTKFMGGSDISHDLGIGNGMFHPYLNSIYPQDPASTKQF